MKRKFLAIPAVFLVIILLVFFVKPKELAAVNGEGVTLAELMAYGDEYANQVASQFADKYHITSYGQHFWEESYQGEQPIDALYEEAVGALVRHRVVKETAVSLKVTEEKSFQEEQKAWENAKMNLSLGQYLAAQDEQLANKIKEAWLKETPPSEKQLAQAFESLENKYKETDYAVSAIEIPGYSGELAALQKIAQQIPAQLSLTECESWWQQQLPQQLVSALTLKSAEFQKDDVYSQSLGSFLSKEEPGTVVVGDQQQFFYIVKVEGGQLLTVEEAPKLAENQYINELYKQRIAKGVKQAKVALPEKIEESFRTSYQTKN